MARLAFLSPLPPFRSDAAIAGSSLVRVLRGLRGHDVVAPWPIPESVEALLGVSDLAIYHLSNDLEDREIYDMAVQRSGLVVLHDLALDRLVRGLMRGHDPVGMESAREALQGFDRLGDLDPGPGLRIPWCAHAIRRARGVIVHSDFAARYLEALGCRTPIFVAPPAAVADRRSLRGAHGRGRRLRRALGPGPVLGVVGAAGLEVATSAAARLGGSAVAVGYEVRDSDGAGAREAPPTLGLPEREMVGWLAACDAVLDLRHPPTGTVSSTAVRALQLGVPVVAASSLSVPDGIGSGVVVLESAPGPEEVAQAVGMALRERMGERGALAVESLAAAVPSAYLRAVEGTLSLIGDPVRWTLGRWAAALVDSGVSEEWVARGYGTTYTEALEELTPG